VIRKPPPPRHTVEKLNDSVRIILPRKKNIFRLLWFGIWLLFFGFVISSVFYILVLMIGGVTGLLGDVSADTGNNIAFIVPIVTLLGLVIILLLMGGMGIYAFLWQIAGKEIIEVNLQSLKLSRQIIRWIRSNSFSLESVSDLRVSQPRWEMTQLSPIRTLPRHNGMIAFDYGAKTFRFGLDIDEAEAKQIISAMRPYLVNKSQLSNI